MSEDSKLKEETPSQRAGAAPEAGPVIAAGAEGTEGAAGQPAPGDPGPGALPGDVRVLERALESAVFGVGITDLQGRVTYVNDAVRRMWGFARKEDILGRPLPEFFDGDGVHQTLAALAAGGGRTGEDVGKRQDGSTFPTQFSANVVYDASGKPVCTIGCFVDITEIKAAEQERREMERRLWEAQKLESLGLLAGGVAHDFNNLLVAVLGSADLALSELPESSPVRRHIEQIRVGARRAADLAHQMLAYSGRGNVIVRAVDLRELVQEMAQLLESSISRKATLRLRLGEDPAVVEGDVTQLRQVVLNLITNAAEAVGEKPGTISVSAGLQRCTADYLREAVTGSDVTPGLFAFLEVSDTGKGMDAETRDRIFDPFFSTKSTGRGLGLSAVLGIVRAHRGAIRLYSEPGRGTAIRVLLPHSDQPIAEDRPPAEVPLSSDDLVLLVDDESLVRRVARRMLEKEGIPVIEAEDGEEAVSLFRANASRIRCVLLDLTMPRMDGEACLRALREIDPDIPVVLSSGYSAAEIAERFAGRGRLAFLQKPYERDKLATALEEAMGDRPREAPTPSRS